MQRCGRRLKGGTAKTNRRVLLSTLFRAQGTLRKISSNVSSVFSASRGAWLSFWRFSALPSPQGLRKVPVGHIVMDRVKLVKSSAIFCRWRTFQNLGSRSLTFFCHIWQHFSNIRVVRDTSGNLTFTELSNLIYLKFHAIQGSFFLSVSARFRKHNVNILMKNAIFE